MQHTYHLDAQQYNFQKRQKWHAYDYTRSTQRNRFPVFFCCMALWCHRNKDNVFAVKDYHQQLPYFEAGAMHRLLKPATTMVIFEQSRDVLTLRYLMPVIRFGLYY